MAENWTSWGDTGPIIGVSATKKDKTDSVDIEFCYMYKRRGNYSENFSSKYLVNGTCYVNDSSIGTVSFYPFDSDSFGLDEVAFLKIKTINYQKTSYTQDITATFTVEYWGGVEWNDITDNPKLRTISTDISIPAIDRLSTPSITTNLGIISTSNNQIQVNWSSVNNASSYYIKATIENTTILDWTKTNSNSYNIVYNNLSSYRGKEITVSVYAVGDSQYADSYTSTKNIAKINNLPTAPTISQSGNKVDGTNSITFTITKGSDDDGQTYSVYYRFNSGDLIQISTNTLIINLDLLKSNNVPSGNNDIIFYTYDGLEYSYPALNIFNVTYEPIISSHSENFIFLSDGLGNKNLVSTVNLKFTLESNLSNPIIELKVKTGIDSASLSNEVIIPNNQYTFNKSNNTISINFMTLSNLYIEYGYYFSLQYRISDGSLYSQPIPWTTPQLRANKPKLPTNTNFLNDSANNGIQVLSNYFKQYVRVSLQAPVAESKFLDIQKIEIVSIYNNQEKTFLIGSNEDQYYELNVDLSYILENSQVYLKIRTTDILGQSATSDILATFIKSSGIQFAGTSINLNMQELKPLSNKQNLIIKHPLAQASGTVTDNIQFQYKITADNTDKPLNDADISIIEEPDIVSVTVPYNYIKDILVQIYGANANIKSNATITVTAIDGFNSTKALMASIEINFTESPQFVNIDFKIRHDYNIQGILSSQNLGIEVPQYIQSDQSSYSLDVRMFNYAEGIIFMLPKSTDLNNDITEYQIFLSRNSLTDLEQAVNNQNLEYGTTPWLSIPLTTLQQVQDENYYYYRYSASQYTKNEYFYFKVRVKDSMGNYSQEKTSNTFIIGARSVNPNFSVGNVEVIRQTDEIQHTDTVTLNYNLQILDLGGSATSSGWNRLYYEKFPNFEREQQNYIPEIFLQISICPSPDFTEDVYTVQTIKGNSPLLDYTSRQVIIENFPSSASKIYMKFELFVSYTTSNDSLAYLISIPSIFSYYGIVPTVAHRKHKIGINTSTIEQDEVFVVENYQGSRYVIFKGTDAQDASKIYTIQFDLLSGNIDGAIIDCGTWDE